MYIFIGAVVLIYVLIYTYIDKLPIYSSRKSEFNRGKYNKFVVSLYEFSLRCIKNGIYYKTRYRPAFLMIQLEGKHYTIYGNIGTFGYYTTEKPIKGKGSEIFFVSWKQQYVEELEISLHHPSGQKEVWETYKTPIAHDLGEYGIKAVYQVPSYTFTEAGEVQVYIAQGEIKVADLMIDVKEA